MNAIFYNTKRKSELDLAVATFYDDCLAQAIIGVIKISKESTATKHKFTEIGNDEVDIATRLLFLNSPLAAVEKFPVFIFAKKGFELTQVLSGLPFRENYEEKTDFTAIRKWSEWHTENNTSIIQENENYVLIRTEVLSIPLTDTELVILNAARQPSSTEPIDLTTSQFQLWGMQEYKALKSVYFPVLEDSL